MKQCPDSSAYKQGTNKVRPIPAFIPHVYGIEPHLLYPLQGW